MRPLFSRSLFEGFFDGDSNAETSIGSTITRAARTPFIVLAVLIAGDLLFIALHLVHLHTSLLQSNRWSIAQDRGFAEMFEYLKYVAICLALARLFIKTRLSVIVGWLAVFAFLLMDDAGRIHERFGLVFADFTGLPDILSLRARDIGELVFALLAGMIVLPLVLYGWLRGGQAARAMSVDLGLLLVALAGCGVGADLLHRMLSMTSMGAIAGVLEDGGEMFVLSLTCAYIAQVMTAQVRFRPARLLGLDTRQVAVTP